MSTGLRATGLKPSVADSGDDICLLAADRGSNCSLTRAVDGHIVRCGVISSCQSAATAFGFQSVSCEKRYSKYRTLPLLFLHAAVRHGPVW